jgi:folate-binding protein YgfZ
MPALPLHALHAALGARFGELRGCEVVQDYGAPEAEYAALVGAAGLQDRSARALIRLTGPDRVSFLHGQTTNEVNQLPEGAGNTAAMLTNRGKMLGEVRVLKRHDDLWVEGDVGFGPSLLEALQRNCISEEVEFEDLSERYGQLGLYGPQAGAILASLAGGAVTLAEHAHQERTLAGVPTIVVGSRSPGVAGFDLFAERTSLEGLWQALVGAGAKPFGEGAFELARIEAGLPRFGADLTEETNPLEANLERDISYQKGCYVGQEVIAKATFRGHVTRKLTGLLFSGPPAPAQSALQLEGRVVGKVTSSTRLPDGRAVGLGFVKRDLAKPGVTLTLAEGGQATTAELPFTSR